MQYQQTLDLWLSRAGEDPDLTAELESVRNDADAVTDRFSGIWNSAPAGCGASIGAGTNRMNIYTSAGPPRAWPTTSTPRACPGRWPSVTTAASRASCSAGRLPGCWPPTASPPGCIPGWSPPRRCPGRCGIWAAARVSASRPATTPPSTTATRSTAPTAARSRWRLPPRCWPPLSSMTILTTRNLWTMTKPLPPAASGTLTTSACPTLWTRCWHCVPATT